MERINLLKMDDSMLVRKTEQYKELTLGGVTASYPIYEVDLSLLYYNYDDYHIASSVNGEDVFEELRSKKNKQDYNKQVGELFSGYYEERKSNSKYRNRDNRKYGYEEYLERIENNYTGIVLSDGLILDGNFIFCELRRLKENMYEPEEVEEDKEFFYLKLLTYMRKNETKPDFYLPERQNGKSQKEIVFRTIILDLDIFWEEKKIKELELDLVFNRINNHKCEECKKSSCTQCEVKNSYNSLDILAGIYRDVKKKQILTPEEYTEILQRDKKRKDAAEDAKRYLRTAELIQEYIVYMCVLRDFENLVILHMYKDYLRTDRLKEEVAKIFEDMQGYMDALPRYDIRIWKPILFIMFFENHDSGDWKRMRRRMRILFSYDIYKHLESDLVKLQREFEKRTEQRRERSKRNGVGLTTSYRIMRDNRDIFKEVSMKIRAAEQHLEEYKDKYFENLFLQDMEKNNGEKISRMQTAVSIEDLTLSSECSNKLRMDRICSVEELLECSVERLERIERLSFQERREILQVKELVEWLRKNKK